MPTYNEINSAWPTPTPVPSGPEAIAGAKRLIKLCFSHAKEEGRIDSCKSHQHRFVVTSGRRHTWIRGGVWYINPDEKRFNGLGGWAEIVHSISHWAMHKFWPHENPHGPRHVWIEKLLTEYAVKHFLDGQLKRPEKVPVDKKIARAIRRAALIERWEAKLRRADNALRKLRRQQAAFNRQQGVVS